MFTANRTNPTQIATRSRTSKTLHHQHRRINHQPQRPTEHIRVRTLHRVNTVNRVRAHRRQQHRPTQRHRHHTPNRDQRQNQRKTKPKPTDHIKHRHAEHNPPNRPQPKRDQPNHTQRHKHRRQKRTKPRHPEPKPLRPRQLRTSRLIAHAHPRDRTDHSAAARSARQAAASRDRRSRDHRRRHTNNQTHQPLAHPPAINPDNAPSDRRPRLHNPSPATSSTPVRSPPPPVIAPASCTSNAATTTATNASRAATDQRQHWRASSAGQILRQIRKTQNRPRRTAHILDPEPEPTRRGGTAFISSSSHDSGSTNQTPAHNPGTPPPPTLAPTHAQRIALHAERHITKPNHPKHSQPPRPNRNRTPTITNNQRRPSARSPCANPTSTTTS